VLRRGESILETKSLVKWKLPGFSSVCMYFGMKYSIDGITFLIGSKIGGVKFIFPIIILNKITQKSVKNTAEEDYENLELLICHAISSSIFGFLAVRKSKKLLGKWR
jgi:hypothetical protein